MCRDQPIDPPEDQNLNRCVDRCTDYMSTRDYIDDAVTNLTNLKEGLQSIALEEMGEDHAKYMAFDDSVGNAYENIIEALSLMEEL